MPKDKIYDLEERTAKFGQDVILVCKKVKKDVITLPLVNQLVKSATSVGANYCEADNAESRADFKHKIGICKKEARESKHWFKMISVATPELKDEASVLMQEANELNLIFNSIIHKLAKKEK
jgi:four helix bundle protein